MTPATEPRRNKEEIARVGTDIYERRVRPLLKPEDDGSFVAIDITTEEYEVHKDDYTAVMSLHRRNPGAEVWLLRAGSQAAHKLGLR